MKSKNLKKNEHIEEIEQKRKKKMREKCENRISLLSLSGFDNRGCAGQRRRTPPPAKRGGEPGIIFKAKIFKYFFSGFLIFLG